MDEEEYELIPLNPLRKMEKRIERLEKGGMSTEMTRELVDVVKSNQRIVDDVVRINSDLISKITDLINSVHQTMSKIDEFINRLEVPEQRTSPEQATTEKPPETPVEIPPAENTVERRLDKLEKRINTLLLSTLAKNRVRPGSLATVTRRAAPPAQLR